MANRLSGSPEQKMVFKSLSSLYNASFKKKHKKVLVIRLQLLKSRLIVFSDQHKGNSSWADDFSICEKNYTSALDYYNNQAYTLISLGDSEELWKFKPHEILSTHMESYVAEAAFQPRRFYKTFGNHDIIWKNKLDVELLLKNIFNMPLPVYEAIVLRSTEGLSFPDIFLTHGHQGDLMSDNNAFSTWIVAHIWMPLQRYLRINPNSARNDFALRNAHNKMMYEWSSRQTNPVLVTGHTHQPVFASGKYFNHPSNDIPTGISKDQLIPSYFNTGCCCYNDGDITGIEIADGFIRLIKWYDEEVKPKRMVLEEIEISRLMKDMGK